LVYFPIWTYFESLLCSRCSWLYSRAFIIYIYYSFIYFFINSIIIINIYLILYRYLFHVQSWFSRSLNLSHLVLFSNLYSFFFSNFSLTYTITLIFPPKQLYYLQEHITYEDSHTPAPHSATAVHFSTKPYESHQALLHLNIFQGIIMKAPATPL